MKIKINIYENDLVAGSTDVIEYDADRFSIRDVKGIIASRSFSFSPDHIIVTYSKEYEVARYTRFIDYQSRYSLPDFSVVRKFKRVRNFRRR